MRLQRDSTTCHHSLGRCKGQIKVPSWSSTGQLVYWDALRHVAVHDCSKSQTVLEAVRKICDTDILQGATRTSTCVEKKDIVEACSLRPPPAATPISTGALTHSTPHHSSTYLIEPGLVLSPLEQLLGWVAVACLSLHGTTTITENSFHNTHTAVMTTWEGHHYAHS